MLAVAVIWVQLLPHGRELPSSGSGLRTDGSRAISYPPPVVSFSIKGSEELHSEGLGDVHLVAEIGQQFRYQMDILWQIVIVFLSVNFVLICANGT